MTRTPALQTEDIAWAVQAALVGGMTAALQETETRRNAEGRYQVTLPPPAIIDFGFDMEALEQPPSAFPRIAFIAAPRTPDERRSDQLFSSATHDVLLEWMVLGKTRQEATLRNWRYGETILRVLISASPFAGFEMMTYVPPVSEGQPLDLDRSVVEHMYVAGGQLTIPLRGEYMF